MLSLRFTGNILGINNSSALQCDTPFLTYKLVDATTRGTIDALRASVTFDEHPAPGEFPINFRNKLDAPFDFVRSYDLDPGHLYEITLSSQAWSVEEGAGATLQVMATTPCSVPEPTTLSLLSLGLLGASAAWKRARARRPSRIAGLA